jgi:hypothetical protein
MAEDRSASQLIVIFRCPIDSSLMASGQLRSPTTNLRPVKDILQQYDASISVLFGPEPGNVARPQEGVSEVRDAPPWKSSTFCLVRGPSPEVLPEIAKKLGALDSVDGAYVKPPAVPAIVEGLRGRSAEQLKTPDYTFDQLYLEGPPEGIGRIADHNDQMVEGSGIHVIDVEYGWRTTHEDLHAAHINTPHGSNLAEADHGTAVAGIIVGDDNRFGITGIAPKAKFEGYYYDYKRPTAISNATRALRNGDVLVIELESPGPNNKDQNLQYGQIPMEWWPDDFVQIWEATKKGIVVVEAAGNGSQNLDDPIYDQAPPDATFPRWWSNPFDIKWGLESQAVMVGAGAPPPGTHGNYDYKDRSRLEYSNYGARVDAQGWGKEVTTAGYGDMDYNIRSPDMFYTRTFGGTSSATAIVAGAIVLVQAVLNQNYDTKMVSGLVRSILRDTGSPQQDGEFPAAERIGNRPDVNAILHEATLKESNWRWCRNCQCLYFCGNANCPAGGVHDHSQSLDYCIFTGAPAGLTQGNWKWCKKCQALLYSKLGVSQCAHSNVHDFSASGSYWVMIDDGYNQGEKNWKWCNKCQGLVFAGGPQLGSCEYGGEHEHTGSGQYVVSFNKDLLARQAHWRRCSKCQMLAYDGFSACPATSPVGGAHISANSANYILSRDDPNAQGQDDWKRCKKCYGLSYTCSQSAGLCPRSGVHDPSQSGNYTLVTKADPVNLPPGTQYDWASCNTCKGLWYIGDGPSRCTGGVHNHDGSEDYSLSFVEG